MRTQPTPPASAQGRPEDTTPRKPQPLSADERLQRYKDDPSFRQDVRELMEQFPRLCLGEATRLIQEG